jgi:hypothetical protein
MVIGPETGVLNAASHMPMAKVIFLSHSSHENLTRDWENVYSIYSENTTCYGRSEGVPACHLMHYSWEYCLKDEATQTAKCQANISVEEVWGCVSHGLQKVVAERAA